MSARQQPDTPSLTPTMVELLASVRRAMPAMETWPAVADGAAQVPLARTDGLAPIPALPYVDGLVDDSPREPAGRSGTAATAGSATPAAEPLDLPAVPVFGGLADVVDNTYNAVEAPIRRLVEAIEDGLTLIGVPVFLASQGTIFYTFGEAVVKSVLFNTTDWLRGEGDFAANLEDLGNDLLAAGLWLTIDELTAFDLLPPTPVDLPRPPMNQDDAQLTMSGEDTESDAAARSGVSVDAGEFESADAADADAVQHDTQTVDGTGTDEPETKPVDETDPANEPADAEPNSDDADTDADAPEGADKSDNDKSDNDEDDADQDGDGDDAPKETSDDNDGSGSDNE